MDTKAFFKLSYGLYVITSQYNNKDSGCIANTFAQVTSEPSQISITLNKNNYTTELIENSRIFNCGVLLDDVSMEVIRHFGFQSGRDVDKFKDIEYFVDEQNVKQIKNGLAATFTCKVNKIVDVGTHEIFIAEVIDAKVLSNEPVLTYSNYHLKKNGATPKNAPSYVEEKKQGYRCTICGFIYEGETLPEDFVCPVCKKDASYFEKID